MSRARAKDLLLVYDSIGVDRVKFILEVLEVRKEKLGNSFLVSLRPAQICLVTRPIESVTDRVVPAGSNHDDGAEEGIQQTPKRAAVALAARLLPLQFPPQPACKSSPRRWEVEILSQNLVRTGEEMGSRERRVVFVTVGTTCFDALVKAVDSDEVKEALLHKGYTDLLIQMG
ncbi:hypothetical protein C2845_PM16G03670 [Panicum miliaceum]|uniref:Uncharacterized protein n=1 Tax=Panicum miliaceum TaxID=4540 RepID=A0A3L6PXV9_PANMI|nr:hypothetical protein C2845_PM16G03670 [Panicum miliaceum]